MTDTVLNHTFCVSAQRIALGQVIYHAVSTPECGNSFSIPAILEPVAEYALDSMSHVFHELRITIQGLCVSLRKQIKRLPFIWQRKVLKVKRRIYVFICKLRC